jgi:hypothetical protein
MTSTSAQKRFSDGLQIKSITAECQLSINRRSLLYARDTIVKMARHAAGIGHYYLSIVLVNVQHDMLTFQRDLWKALFEKGFPIASVKKCRNSTNRIRVHVAWHVHM